MVSRENTVVLVCIAAAMALYFVLVFQRYVSVQDWLAFAVILVVGVVLPQLVNGYLDAGSA